RTDNDWAARGRLPVIGKNRTAWLWALAAVLLLAPPASAASDNKADPKSTTKADQKSAASRDSKAETKKTADEKTADKKAADKETKKKPPKKRRKKNPGKKNPPKKKPADKPRKTAATHDGVKASSRSLSGPLPPAAAAHAEPAGQAMTIAYAPPPTAG